MKFYKFKFWEDCINPETGKPNVGDTSPVTKETKFFGTKTLHRIVKIEYEEREIKEIKTTVDDNGDAIDEEVTRIEYIEKPGEQGGLLEHMDNLAQEGTCWVEGDAVVCESAKVYGEVQISGSVEVGGSAWVGDKAEVSGDVGISGFAFVYGEAKISGSKRIAVGESARVEGEVTGKATVTGSAYVGPGATIEGEGSVSGESIVYGKVSGGVLDRAIVMGEVGKKCQAYGDAYIDYNGVLDDEAAVANGYINGTIKDTSLTSGHPYILDGEVASSEVEGNVWTEGKIDECTISGNVFIEGTDTSIKESEIRDNANIANNVQESTITGNVDLTGVGAIKESTVEGNVTAERSIDNSYVEGNAWAYGKVTDGYVGGNALVGSENGVDGGEVAENARIFGRDAFTTRLRGNSAWSEGSGVGWGNVVLKGGSKYLEGNIVLIEDGDQTHSPADVIMELEDED